MATKSGQKGRYLCKVGYLDIRAKDTFKKATKFSKPEVSNTDLVIYHSRKLVESGFKTKEAAVERAKELLGESGRKNYNIR
jgi:SNF2 family DNA or RNA helicase